MEHISIIFFYFTILYWFFHTSTWICHECTRIPHPEPPSHLPSHTIPLGHPSVPAPSILYPASNLDWRLVSYMIYMFQCHSPKSSHTLPLPQSPKHCSIHLCLFCCLGYMVIVILICIFVENLFINIQKTKIMAFGPITSWEIDGETVETVSDFILGAPKSLQMMTWN